MTGEMYHINQEGKDDSGNEWPIHAAIAKALCEEGYDATLQPFDQYQGPYILVGKDIRVGQRPYQLAVQNMGVIRLWLTIDDEGEGLVYREDMDISSDAFWCNDIGGAIDGARELMARTQGETTK